MTTMIWLPFLVKALATALIVASASVVAEARTIWQCWSPACRCRRSDVLAMRHGEDFVAASALSSFAAYWFVPALFMACWPGRLPPWRCLGVLARLACLAMGLVAWGAARFTSWARSFRPPSRSRSS